MLFTIFGYICLVVILLFVSYRLYNFGKLDTLEIDLDEKIYMAILGVFAILSGLGLKTFLATIITYALSIIIVGAISYTIGYLSLKSDQR